MKLPRWLRRLNHDVREQAPRVNPPPSFDTGGWTCSDCGTPCYAFGHLHEDGTWHDARSPAGGILRSEPPR
jgi:hypothetical protein